QIANDTAAKATLTFNQTTSNISQTATGAAARAKDLTNQAVEYTGLSSLLSSTFEWIDLTKQTFNQAISTTKEAAVAVGSTAKDVAATLIEEGKGVSVSCYSPTCKPGQVCYAPTCARGRTLSVNLTVDNFQSIIKGMYLEGQRTAGLLTAH
ncbi:hypothetical protein HDU99_006128, partial [Rhizoclosmatium hyalinum]